ncbi:MAG: sugar phosphorylase [Anaerolineales bacterium]|nr:sugar phosphorylase [Anaerolineales bacterium]
MTTKRQIRALLKDLYGEETAGQTYVSLLELLESYRPTLPEPRPFAFSQSDAVLITYADNIRKRGRTPLAAMKGFLKQYVGETVPTIHLLPFFPFSSDDGFSVIDYKSVDPASGSWEDVEALSRDYRLMFDAVINHISVESGWFQGFLRDDPIYKDYFITVEPGTDLSQVFRPRALPLLTSFDTPSGLKLVWTTFSEDQADLNFENPRLLLEVIDVLLFYVRQGAHYIRLDAIAFLWKIPGTASIHLPQTHAVIQLFRLVLDEVAPQTVLITETNVPHEDNISYFGDGKNEAQMVYNFSLPPLVMHSIHQGDAGALTEWARGLSLPSGRTTFFNFLASHDGVGVTPARGLLADAEINALGERVEALGGHVSYKNNPDGTRSPYELNINYLDALGDPQKPDEEPELLARRFLLSQAVMLALRGVPGIYIHSLIGSHGWPEGVEQTGRYRTINREKLRGADIERDLNDPDSLRSRVFYPYLKLLELRSAESRTAFSPIGEQEILMLDRRVFALKRISPSGDDRVFCLNNVSNQNLEVLLASDQDLRDLIGGENYPAGKDGQVAVSLAPYQVAWLV